MWGSLRSYVAASHLEPVAPPRAIAAPATSKQAVTSSWSGLGSGLGLGRGQGEHAARAGLGLRLGLRLGLGLGLG